MIWEILRLFINTLTAKDKYSLLNREHLRQPIHIQMSQKQKRFSGIFFAFLESVLHLEHFQKKMTLITDVFKKLRTPKNVDR